MIFPGLNRKYQYLKQYIHNIKKLLKRQRQNIKDKDKPSLRMELDRSDYYIRLIAKDKNNIFRVFADSLYFSQSNYKEVKGELFGFIRKNSNTFKNLLNFVKSDFESSEEYLEEINRSSDEPEITLTILAFIFERNLEFLYSDENCHLRKYKLDFGFSKSVTISILDNSGGFDTVYAKEHIKHCGLVQSLLYDVVTATMAQLEGDSDSPIKDLRKASEYN